MKKKFLSIILLTVVCLGVLVLPENNYNTSIEAFALAEDIQTEN